MKKLTVMSIMLVVIFAVQANTAPYIEEIGLAGWNAKFSSSQAPDPPDKVFETRGRYGGTGWVAGIRHVDEASSPWNTTVGGGYDQWPKGGDGWDFEISYDLSEVSYTVDDFTTMTRAATDPAKYWVFKVNAGGTDGGSVVLDDLVLEAGGTTYNLGKMESVTGANGGERFFEIKGANLLDGFTLSGTATMDWADNGTPSDEGLKFDSVAFVPEPATVGLLGLGSLVLLRKKRKA